MNDLAEGVGTFQRDVFPAKAELFAHLADSHRPSTLFISCSDARVVPELITSSEPGELFVVRTAGNLVPAYTPAPDGIAASIEYAVAVLGVKEIVVCGHSACGAMTALAAHHDLSGAPAIAHWLRHADASVARTMRRRPGRGGAGARERARPAREPGHPPLGGPGERRERGQTARLGVRHSHRNRRGTRHHRQGRRPRGLTTTTTPLTTMTSRPLSRPVHRKESLS